jgi:hypothetical protein
MLITFSPGGFEGCFRELVGAAPDQFETIATACGCSVVGPGVWA